MIEPNQIGGSGRPAAPGGRRKTIIEDESPGEIKPAFGTSPPQQPQRSKTPATKRFSPQVRPPIAKLYVLDDTGLDGEVIRIRGDEYRIGRASGDLVIEHDGQMSGEHVAIRRELTEGNWRWTVVDLDSTNGLFVRVTEVPLEDNLEVWIGGRLYRFELGEQGLQTMATPTQAPVQRTGTMVASVFQGPTQSTASLIEVNVDGDGRAYPLSPAGQWIGRDASRCQIVIDDPMLGSQDTHAFIDDDGNWGLKKGKSLNGIWVRVRAVPLVGKGMQFQCGEQRFALRLD